MCSTNQSFILEHLSAVIRAQKCQGLKNELSPILLVKNLMLSMLFDKIFEKQKCLKIEFVLFNFE